MITRLPCPEPGVYFDVPPETYHAWPAASRSRLLRFRQSPAHVLASMEDREEGSAALQLGTWEHCYVLEPERFEQMAAVGPDCNRNNREWKDWAEAQGGNPWLLKPSEMETVHAMRESLRSHPVASAALWGNPGRNEVSMVFDDAATGVRCKARADRITGLSLFDVKTCQSAGWRKFQYDALDFGYYLEAEMHQRAFRARYGREIRFIAVAVESKPPYAVACYVLKSTHAEEELDTHLRAWASCQRTGKWPGYPEELTELQEPDTRRFTPDRSEEFADAI